MFLGCVSEILQLGLGEESSSDVNCRFFMDGCSNTLSVKNFTVDSLIQYFFVDNTFTSKWNTSATWMKIVFWIKELCSCFH